MFKVSSMVFRVLDETECALRTPPILMHIRGASSICVLDGQGPPIPQKAIPARVLNRQTICRDSSCLLAKAGRAGEKLRQALPQRAKSPPEYIPRLTWVPAHEDVRAIADGVILDAVRNRKMACQFARRKHGLRGRRAENLPRQPSRAADCRTRASNASSSR